MTLYSFSLQTKSRVMAKLNPFRNLTEAFELVQIAILYLAWTAIVLFVLFLNFMAVARIFVRPSLEAFLMLIISVGFWPFARWLKHRYSDSKE